MTLAIPLQVRLVADGVRALDAGLLDDLSLSNSAPGGYRTATCKLSRPISLPTRELNPYTQLEVVDTRTGEQVWFGRLEDPGRTSAQVWSLTAVGGMTHAQDNHLPVIYNDSRNGVWRRREENVMPNGTWGQGSDNNTDDPMVFTIPRGTVVPASGRVVAVYDLLTGTGQHVAYAAARHVEGISSSGLEVQYVGRYGPGADTNLAGQTFSTTQQTLAARLGVDFTTLHSGLDARIILTGGAFTAAADTYWSQLLGGRIIPTRLTRYGAELTTGYPNQPWVPIDSIVEDVLGRFCPEFDRAGSTVDTSSTAQVTQLAYEDGTTAGAILDDLMGLAPTHYWAAWGNDNGRGAVFAWKPWPSRIALANLDTQVDEFDGPGSAADLANQVSVRYKDANDVTRWVLRTGYCPALSAAGLTRRALLDLGGTAGDKAQAAAAGDAYLAAHKYPTNSGTIKVSRPVVDQETGRTLQPWQLRSGVLACVRNLEPRPDDLNPISNGQTVFRVSDVTYSAKDNTATLTLDSYGRTVARALARLAKTAERTRRV